MTTLAAESVLIDQLVPHPQNARRGNLEAIKQSIKEHGFVGFVAAQAGTNRIIIGRHRWQAAKELGHTEIPVVWLYIDNEKALRLLLADNRASDLAGYENDKLLQTLRDIGNLQGTLFDQDALEDLISAVEGAPVVINEYEFQGGYAPNDEKRTKEEVAESASHEMRDVVLMMNPAVYQKFVANIKLLAKRWNMNGIIAPAIAAVDYCAQDATVAAGAETKVKQMQEWGKALEWAVPHTDRQRFKESFEL